ncbi:MAG: glycerol-3-phosphate dehydrogenase C-terminal domain-containing protein, partial [Solirubrobacterales bacterium]
EQARSVADVLLRRTRLGLLAAPELRDAGPVGTVAKLLGTELGWSESRVAKEVDAWAEVVALEGLDPAASLT